MRSGKCNGTCRCLSAGNTSWLIICARLSLRLSLSLFVCHHAAALDLLQQDQQDQGHQLGRPLASLQMESSALGGVGWQPKWLLSSTFWSNKRPLVVSCRFALAAKLWRQLSALKQQKKVNNRGAKGHKMVGRSQMK